MLNIITQICLKLHNYQFLVYTQSLQMYLLFKEIEGDTNLKGKAPELVETLTEIDNTICVSTHKVHHLYREQ